MDDAFTLLRLQIEWGADEALDPDPLDRLRAVEAPAAPALPRPRPVPAAPVSLQPKVAAAERAVAAAGQAASPEALREAVAAFDGCALRDTASHTVWAEGDPDSPVLIIGEAPGREEDRSGRPFAGAEGALLDQMLASIGLKRDQLMLTPLLPWRPPGGRPPNAAELGICLPFLHRLIVLTRPQRLVAFGATAGKALLPGGGPARRRQAAGWIDCSIPGLPAALPLLALPSLGEMLATPAIRRVAWAGLRLLRRTLDAA